MSTDSKSLVRDLRGRGISVLRSNGKLRVQGPAGAITARDRHQLELCKPELLTDSAIASVNRIFGMPSEGRDPNLPEENLLEAALRQRLLRARSQSDISAVLADADTACLAGNIGQDEIDGLCEIARQEASDLPEEDYFSPTGPDLTVTSSDEDWGQRN